MLTETIAAFLLSICLACFAIINLHNILVVHKRRGKTKPYAEVEQPSDIIVGIAAIGTFVYFLEALAFVFLAFINIIPVPYYFPFTIQTSFTPYLQTIGSILSLIGYYVSIWSVRTRGIYATSWQMTENHKLVTHGPYHYVRHPSYLSYFLMFIGLPLTWPNLFTLFPFLAIPGYVRVTHQEEKLLTQRFGDEYWEYQKKTGRFIPKLL